MTSNISKSKKYFLSISLVVVISAVAAQQLGCSSSLEVIAKQSSTTDDTIKKTEFLMWWGFGDVSERVECNGQGLQYVTSKTNFLYSLCAVVTLGAVVPMDVEYRCTSTNLQDGGEIGLLRGGDR